MPGAKKRITFTTVGINLDKIIETLATINLCFDDYLNDRTLLYAKLVWLEDQLVKLKQRGQQ